MNNYREGGCFVSRTGILRKLERLEAELSASGLNNDNKYDGWYCDDCYKEVHEEK